MEGETLPPNAQAFLDEQAAQATQQPAPPDPDPPAAPKE
jgi:hypothetical protein